MALTKVKGNVIEDGSITDSNFPNTEITSADMALDPRNASNLSSGQVPLAQLGNVPAVDLTGLEDDIALVGFKIAANGSLSKYNLIDQTVDAFEDASGVDAGTSTNEYRDSSGKYYSGTEILTPTIETFTGNGTYNNPAAITSVEYLVVAGGGSGGGGVGAAAGGGGGAGGYRAGTLSVTASTSYPITVGNGGGGVATNTKGNSGLDSVFSTITATGGGGAGGGDAVSDAPKGSGLNGGSGGGASGSQGAASHTAGSGNTPSTSPAQGYAGGHNANSRPGSGGGGASEAGDGAGGNANATGYGGDGTSNDISGSAVTYAGGGGGGTYSGGPPGAAGGSGGGGRGGEFPGANGVAGTANTGGGGGGGGAQGSGGTGAAGGSGIVIISWPAVLETYNNMTLVSNLTAAQAAPTKGDIVFTYTNGAGTAVINTNITAEISADNGSTWTAFTLASQGTTGGHTILTSHDQTITSTITAPYNMRYRIKTLVQSAAMDTRIHAVSLGWS